MNAFFFYLFSIPSHQAWKLFFKTSFWLVLKLALLWGGINLIERLQISSPSFAFKQIAQELTLTPDPHLQEAKALASFASKVTDIYSLQYVRFTKADKLYQMGASARFNPFLLRITLQKDWEQLSPHTQRWTVLHELGHAAALASLRLTPLPVPTDTLSAQAQRIVQSSLTYQQSYSESFAELFALALMLQLDPKDPKAEYELLLAQNATLQSVDLAHDSAPALLLASSKLPSLQTLQGVALLNLIDSIATHAALLQVAGWGAQIDAYCSSNSFSIPAWIASRGHMTFSNPWSILHINQHTPTAQLPQEVVELQNAFSSLHEQRLRQLEHHKDTYLLAKENHLLPQDIISLQNQLQSSEERAQFKEKQWALTLAALENATQSTLRTMLFDVSYFIAAALDPKKASTCSVWKQTYSNGADLFKTQ